MNVLWSSGIMRRASLEVLMVSLLAGVIGVHVVLSRRTFLTMAVSHASFPGVVLAAWLGIGRLTGSLAFTIVVVMALIVVDDAGLASSTTMGVLLAASMGLGAIGHSVQTTPAQNLSAVLTGSLIGVTGHDLVITGALVVLVAITVGLLHKELVFMTFDAPGARAAGYGIGLRIAFELSIAATVVLTVPALGTVLAPSLIIVPALAARFWSDRIGGTMVAAVLIAVIAAIVGLWWSATADIAVGPAVALTATGLFVFSNMLAPFGAWRSRTTAWGPAAEPCPPAIPPHAAP